MIKKAVFYIFLVLFAVLNLGLWYHFFVINHGSISDTVAHFLVLALMAGTSAIILVPMWQDAFRKGDC